MAKIKLTKRQVAIVDDSDFEWLNQYKWHINNKGYAIRSINKGNNKIFMHRLINNTLKGFDTDHIDGNPLNNQKNNLRTVTHKQNMWNMHKLGVGVTKYKGKWRARITVNGKQINLGTFLEVKTAIKVRYNAERLYYAI